MTIISSVLLLMPAIWSRMEVSNPQLLKVWFILCGCQTIHCWSMVT